MKLQMIQELNRQSKEEKQH